ncbi:Subtilisin inhibitor-like [Actinacidiphila yanglinensis]|uniref:Subtilisin inhibitor-like n=1 Tax=Actinacidiphila yanglinensis TaxID=310779 RepID=A0A1H6ACU2_9ACTN|nr:SSI family serine proteinase inhibitor [Actinacidiphila yanglinensis]SEG45994.1 Subtilisin inhibitor-like [Actinacidiphila yanglinensis]
MHTSQLALLRLARGGAVALIGTAVITGVAYGAAQDAANGSAIDAAYGSATHASAQTHTAMGTATHTATASSPNGAPYRTAPAARGSQRVGGLLDVAYDDGAGHTRSYRLSCGAATRRGAGRAATADACAQLDTIGGPAPAVPAGQACSMIYGGPQTARVTGTWQGRTVQESYRRTNGCEVTRWNRMVPALPNPVADASRTAPVRG